MALEILNTPCSQEGTPDFQSSRARRRGRIHMVDITNAKHLSGVAAPRRSHTTRFLAKHPHYVVNIENEKNVEWLLGNAEACKMVVSRLKTALKQFTSLQLYPAFSSHDAFEATFKRLRDYALASDESVIFVPTFGFSTPSQNTENPEMESSRNDDDSSSDRGIDVLDEPPKGPGMETPVVSRTPICNKCEIEKLNREFQADLISMTTMLEEIQSLNTSSHINSSCKRHAVPLEMQFVTPDAGFDKLKSKLNHGPSPLSDIQNIEKLDPAMVERCEKIRRMRLHLCVGEETQ